jgi:hypothetical protein
MLFQEWGPFITVQVVLKNIAPAILTAALWATGHQIWLIAKGEAPSWMVGQSHNANSNTTELYRSYLYKDIAWGINICWICVQLFIPQQNNVPHYKPIIGNIFFTRFRWNYVSACHVSPNYQSIPMAYLA